MNNIFVLLLLILFIHINYIKSDRSDIEQVRIAYGHNSSSEMIIMWVTSQGSENNNSIVNYGIDPNNLQLKGTGKYKVYTYNNPLEDDYTSGLQHHVYLKNLQPLTKYYYKCGDLNGNANIYSFRSGNFVGPEIPHYFGFIGDLGQTEHSQETMNAIMKSNNIESIIHVGDLSYADATQTRWDTWGRMTEPLSSYMPWMLAPGNHEEEPNPETLVFFEAFQNKYYMPSSESGVRKKDLNLYYSIDIASCHIIFLTSYVDYDKNSHQYKWFLNDLANFDRNVTPWLLISVHAPHYNSNNIHQKEAEDMRKKYEPIFVQNHVDVVFAGHVHSYEATYRTVNYQRNNSGAMYIVIGDGGNREGLYSHWIQPKPEWSRFRSGVAYGHGEFIVYNSSIAEWKWSKDDIISSKAPIGDQITIESFYSKLNL